MRTNRLFSLTFSVFFLPLLWLGHVSLDLDAGVRSTPTPFRLEPVTIRIPAAHVDARIVAVDIGADGVMASPSSTRVVGWYSELAGPGEVGNMVMAGFFKEGITNPAVFSELHVLRRGDAIDITDNAGITRHYVVDWVRTYEDRLDVPLVEITGNSPTEVLTLITGAEPFDLEAGDYLGTTIVRANRAKTTNSPSISSEAAEDSADPEIDATVLALQTQVAALTTQVADQAPGTPTPMVTPTPSVSTIPTPTTTPTSHFQTSIGGTALDLLPAGSSDSLELVAVGPYTNHIPVVVRNNSGADLERPLVYVTVRSSDGSVLASGKTEPMYPTRLGPSDVAFGYIPLGGIGLPADAVFDFSLESSPVQALDEYNFLDLEIIETAELPDRIVGEARNGTDRAVEHAVATLMCFNDEGLPTHSLLEGLNPETVRPDETASFQILSRSYEYSGECAAYLVAAHGFDQP